MYEERDSVPTVLESLPEPGKASWVLVAGTKIGYVTEEPMYGGFVYQGYRQPKGGVSSRIGDWAAEDPYDAAREVGRDWVCRGGIIAQAFVNRAADWEQRGEYGQAATSWRIASEYYSLGQNNDVLRSHALAMATRCAQVKSGVCPTQPPYYSAENLESRLITAGIPRVRRERILCEVFNWLEDVRSAGDENSDESAYLGHVNEARCYPGVGVFDA